MLALQDQADAAYINPDVVDYMVALISATRNDPMILRGASPRATLSVTAVSKAVAQLRGRDYVTPRDVQEVFQRVIAHRLLLTPKAEASGVTAEVVLGQILEAVRAPGLH